MSSHRPQFDKIVHEQSRLAILVYLSSRPSSQAAFPELREKVGLSAGNLSVQLSNLEEAGYVDIIKEFIKNKTNTSVQLNRFGRQALETYFLQMELFIGDFRNTMANPCTGETQE